MLRLLWTRGRGPLALLMALSGAHTGVLAAVTWAGQATYRALGARGGAASMAVLLATTGALLLAHGGILVLQRSVAAALAQRLGAGLQAALLAEVLGYRYAFFHAHTGAELAYRMDVDCRAMAERAAKLAVGLAETVQLAVWAGLFLPTLPGMAAAVAATGAAVAGWVLVWRRRIEASDRTLFEGYASLWKVIGEAVQGVRAVKLELLHARAAERLAGVARPVEHVLVRNNGLNTALWGLLAPLPWILTSAALVLGVEALRRDPARAPQALLALLFVEWLIAPLQAVLEGLIGGPGFVAAQRAVEAFLDGEAEGEGPRAMGGLAGAIVLAGVRYAHPGAAFQLPQGRLELRRGCHAALLGRTGSGKSTLLALLPRLVDPDEGAVRVDGVDAREFTLRSLRARVVAVTQEARLLPGTLRDNVDLRGRLSDDEIRALLERVGLGALAAGRGLDAPVADGGGNFSGGERQRIAILRAWALRPDVLLLDEPTAALDPESAERVCALLYAPRNDAPATLTVTHDPAVLGHMNEVHRIVAGRIERVTG